MLAYGAEPKFGVVSDSGVNSEVEERWVTTDSAEGSEVSSLGKVGGGVGERSGISAEVTAPSGVDRVRPGVVRVRSEFICEARSGLGVEMSGGSEVTPRLEAASGMSRGAESGVTGGPGGSGEADGAGEAAGGAVLAAVGRCSRRSGHSFLREPGGGGKTDGRGQLAPPTPLACPAPPGRSRPMGGLGALQRHGSPADFAPPQRPTSPPPVMSPDATWRPPKRAREVEGGEGYRGRWEGAETWWGGRLEGLGEAGRKTRECGDCGGLPGEEGGAEGRGDEGANRKEWGRCRKVQKREGGCKRLLSVISVVKIFMSHFKQNYCKRSTMNQRVQILAQQDLTGPGLGKVK